MPPAAAGGIAAGVGGLSLLDQLFGSGKKRQDSMDEANALQRMLAEAQLPDIERRTALNQWLEQYFKGGIAGAEGSLPPMINVDGGISDYLRKSGFNPFDESTLTPWAEGGVRNNFLEMLMGLGGNVGTGGIAGNANTSTALGVRSQDQFQQTVAGIVDMLMKSQQAAPVDTFPQGTAYNDAFSNQLAMGGLGRG